MAYDFNRPFVDSKQLPNYVATDIQEARLYGNTVRAVEMSNAEYSARFRKFSADRTMKPAPSHGRIFPGYLVVRKIDTKAEYETWMPDHVFEDIYVASSRQKSERIHDPAYVLHIDGAAEKALRSMRDKVGERTKVRVKNSVRPYDVILVDAWWSAGEGRLLFNYMDGLTEHAVQFGPNTRTCF